MSLFSSFKLRIYLKNVKNALKIYLMIKPNHQLHFSCVFTTVKLFAGALAHDAFTAPSRLQLSCWLRALLYKLSHLQYENPEVQVSSREDRCPGVFCLLSLSAF